MPKNWKSDVDNKTKHILRKIIENFMKSLLVTKNFQMIWRRRDCWTYTTNWILLVTTKYPDTTIRNIIQVQVKPTMSWSNANGTTDATQQPIQANYEGNLRSDLLKEVGMLSPLRNELTIRGQIDKNCQKSKLTYVSLMHQIKQARLTDYTDQ